MKQFLSFLEKKLDLCAKSKSFGGFFVGEKVLKIAFSDKFVVLCGDFVTASKLKKGLLQVGKKVQIVSSGRENEDERDVNLAPFAKNLSAFLRGQLDGLIFLPSSLCTKFDVAFLKKSLEICVGQEVEIDTLAKNLTDFGFERVDYVSAPGQFAVRGDVMDVFVDDDHPTRVEFFDDEIEKISKFDFSTMKTLEKCEKMCIFPIFLKNGKNTVFDLCKNLFVDEPVKIANECAILAKSREQLPWAKPENFLDFESVDLKKCGATIFTNTENADFENKTIGQKSYVTNFLQLKADLEMLSKSGFDVFLFAGDYDKILCEFLQINNFSFQIFGEGPENPLTEPLMEQNSGKNKAKDFKNEAKNNEAKNETKNAKNETKNDEIKNETKNAAMDEQKNAANNSEKNISKKELKKDFSNSAKNAKIYIVKQQFSFSFSFLKSFVVGIGTDDLYKTRTVVARGKQSFSYLPKVGDFVVHSFYGIGRCKEIVRMKLAHFEKDYFVLEYKNGALLYLPSEQADLLTAYVGGEDPKLNALGSSEWTRLKEKVKQDLKEIAFSLANIYKQRREKKGFAFAKDEQLEQQFAAEFPFELTADQVSAIADVDKDMESERIMDRLICGDVGFGKTEVAFRAMFKCVYNAKQVAFLCPTTILSQQHFRSAKARFEKFGIRIEVLNRFKTAAQIKEIYDKVAQGKVDILIGTHAILNEHLAFKDLGLLVLDEEQRFGVKDKEKIKKMKTDVDVLTLSATPIPRTLHMSLSGIRDISIIATPPRERLPIQTYVSSYSDTLLESVISRELARHGKALVLYNKVASIYDFAAHVASLLPNARIGVAHGQMEEKTLAKVIDDLYDNKFDVLVSTTLIENGIDLPTLNTLFVCDCDMLGLGQLYQIRGRIGRSDKLAYAYLTYDGGKILTTEAYKRLEAIKEFRELGSGFKIAMRDLEIRGAGNVLGKQQHGHMQKVGYDMYVRLLDEVTREVSGQKPHDAKEIKMELVLDAFIGQDYIPSQEERIIFYNKISHIATKEEFSATLAQLCTAYGDVPKEVENLCKIAFLKNLAEDFGVKKIVINSAECLVYLYKTTEIVDKRLSKTLGFFDACLKFEELPIIKLNKSGRVVEKLDALTNMFLRAKSEKE